MFGGTGTDMNTSVLQLRERVHLLDSISMEPCSEGFVSGRSFCDPPLYDVTTDDGEIKHSLPAVLVRSADGE